MSKNEEIVAPRGGASKCEFVLHFVGYGERDESNNAYVSIDMKTCGGFQLGLITRISSPSNFGIIDSVSSPVLEQQLETIIFLLRICTSLALSCKTLHPATYYLNSWQLTNYIHSCFYRRISRIVSSI